MSQRPGATLRRSGPGLRRGWACLVFLLLLLGGGGFAAYRLLHPPAPPPLDRTTLATFLPYPVAGRHRGTATIDTGGTGGLPYEARLEVDANLAVVAAEWTDVNHRGAKETVTWQAPTDVRFQALLKKTHRQGSSMDGRIDLRRDGRHLRLSFAGGSTTPLQEARFEFDSDVLRPGPGAADNGLLMPDATLDALVATVTAAIPGFSTTAIPSAQGLLRFTREGVHAQILKIAEGDPRLLGLRGLPLSNWLKNARVHIRLASASMQGVAIPHLGATNCDLHGIDLDTRNLAAIANKGANYSYHQEERTWRLRVVFRRNGERYVELPDRDETYREAGNRRSLKRRIRFPIQASP